MKFRILPLVFFSQILFVHPFYLLTNNYQIYNFYRYIDKCILVFFFFFHSMFKAYYYGQICSKECQFNWIIPVIMTLSRTYPPLVRSYRRDFISTRTKPSECHLWRECKLTICFIIFVFYDGVQRAVESRKTNLTRLKLYEITRNNSSEMNVWTSITMKGNNMYSVYRYGLSICTKIKNQYSK